MVFLKEISNYIKEMANTIGQVLELDVLIVDNDLKILGDSDLEEISNESCIKKDSILASVMNKKKKIIINSTKEFDGCLNCNKIDVCPVKKIIGIPLVYKDIVIGALGIIANTEDDKVKMHNNRESYFEFIDRMIELILNKLKEKEEYKEISLLSKRMEIVLDSVDETLLLVSSKGKILNSNFNFRKNTQNKDIKNIHDFLPNYIVETILNRKEEIKYREISLYNKLFLLSSKPLLLDNVDKGSILIFKSLEDVSKEMDELYNHSMDLKFDDLIGVSKEVEEIKNKIKQISKSSSTILINGETGTGKEVVARLIHNISKRSKKSFVAINCSAIPEELIESELFGYEEGAFSGAKRGGKIGKFQLAHGGTIFLDEIGEMKLHLQSKLLRVLQEKCITKVGGLETMPIDVRVIAATNKKLDSLVNEGQFREDLYYRLNVIPFNLPPLRERQGDIKELLIHFLDVYSKKLGKNINSFSKDALELLVKHPYYGNVRELKNAVEFSINIASGSIITTRDLPSSILNENEIKKDTLNIDKNVKSLIKKALKSYGNTTIGKKKAAKSLGISIATLYRKINKYEID